MSKTSTRRAREKRACRKRRLFKQFPITVDIEGRMSAMELGTRMHQEIERVMAGASPDILSGHFHVGDTHIGDRDFEMREVMRYASMDQMRAYAGGDVVVIHGGDLIHDVPVNHGGDLYAHDLKLAKEVLDEMMRSVIRAVKPTNNEPSEP